MSISQRPASERVRDVLREMKEKDLIDFTNKNDYAPKLKQISKDQSCSYSVCYDQMKKIAKEKGFNVGTDYKKMQKTLDKQKQHEFKFSAKKSTLDEGKLQKQKAELDAKKKTMETELAMHNMILKSDAFQMVKTSNTYVLLMMRELFSGFGVKVAEPDKFEMMGGMLASEEMRGGLSVPHWLTTAMLVVGLIGLFAIPAIPQIRAFLNEEKEDKEKKTDKPIGEIKNKELKNEKKEPEKKVES